MRGVEIITHCWVVSEELSHYAEGLRWLMASCKRHRDGIPVVLTVCHHLDDPWTGAALVKCQQLAEHGLLLNPIALDRDQLFRRAIGRNIAAKETTAQCVWFADCDYFAGPGFFQQCIEQIAETDALCRPATCKRQCAVDGLSAWEIGMRGYERERDYLLPRIVENEYSIVEEKQAIGGQQFVGGQTARAYGYLDGTRWVVPVSVDDGWRRTREDPAYRRHLKNKMGSAFKTKVLGLNLYRSRHTANGRDFDASGLKLGKDCH